MPMPCAPPIILAHKARTELQAWGRASSTPPSLGLRARSVLRAADTAAPPPRHIGRALGCGNHPVGTGRRRSRALGVSGLQDAIRPGRPRRIAASTRVQGISVASARPQDQGRPGPRGTLEESVATWLDALHPAPRSRARLWRIRHALDRKPPKRADGLQRHAADFAAQAHTLCPLYAQASASSQHGRLGSCGAAKTGLHVLERPAPTPPAPPGRRARRAQADIRHGTRGLLNSLVVATGHRAWTSGPTRKATECVAQRQRAPPHWPRLAHAAGGMDTWHPPGSRAGCRLGARWGTVPCAPAKLHKGGPRRACLRAPRPRHVLHGTPTHGAWRNPAAWFVRVLPRRLLARGRWPSAKDFEHRGEGFLQA
jgi:hypothetical protein